MFEFFRDFEADCMAARDVSASRRLHPALVTFERWLGANASQIPVIREGG